MPDIILPNLSLELPDIGADQDTWGDILNADLMKLDAVFSLTGTPVSLSSVSVATLAATGAITAGSISTANATITGGSINNTTIGASIRAIGNFTNLDYSGTLTGGTGVINIGMGQIFKDAAGNVGVGTSSPSGKLDVVGTSGTVRVESGGDSLTFTRNGANYISAKGGAAGTLIFETGGAIERLRIDSAGNAGLGVVPSAWNEVYKAFQFGARGAIAGDTGQSVFGNNWVNTALGDRYIQTDFASAYSQSQGRHIFFTAPSGTAGAPISFTQAMTLTQGGNLLVGTTTDIGRLAVSNGAFRNETIFDGVGVATQALNEARSATAVQSLYGSEIRLFSGAAGGQAERARITSAGYFKASNTGVYPVEGITGNNAAGSQHQFNSNLNDTTIVVNSSSTGSNVTNVASYLASGAQGFHFTGSLNGVSVYQVLANGNVQNTNNSYGAISDAKLKENVVDVSSYLDRFMQVRFRNFNFIGSDLKQFGVIAQELEQVFPGLVDESPDFEQVTKTRTVEVPAVLDEEGVEVTPATTREEEYTESVPTGTVTKSVKYSILAQIQGKVIQEQQALITAQQATIDSILARVAALEAK